LSSLAVLFGALGVGPEVIEEIKFAANHVSGVHDIAEVQVKWVGHRLLAEVNKAISSSLTVEQGHEIAKEVPHQLLHHLRYLSNATIYTDPITASGEEHHRIAGHIHDELPIVLILCSTPPHSNSFQPTPAKVRVSRKPWLE